MIDLDFTHFEPHSHLGDCIDTLILLENYGMIENKIFSITSENDAVKTLLSIFDFKFVKITDEKRKKITKHWGVNRTLWTILKNLKKQIHLPTYLLSTNKHNDNTLMQFDSRSAKGQTRNDGSIKTPMKYWEIKQAIKKWSTDPMFLIGGQDTINYFPKVPLHKGNLEYLTKELDECKFFIGACSGMAHLAGLLKKPGIVITLYNYKELAHYYKRIFPSLQCYPRTVLTYQKLY